MDDEVTGAYRQCTPAQVADICKANERWLHSVNPPKPDPSPLRYLAIWPLGIALVVLAELCR